jgi:glycosyltransferase involved in cell wall biosynthesis
MRLLHVVLNLEAGGLERLVVELANRTDSDRFESHVLVLQYAGRHARDLRRDVALHTSPPLSSWSMVWPSVLTRTLRRIEPDIVHTHSGVWYKASLAARVAGIRRTIHTDHGRLMPDPWPDRLSDGLAARRTMLVVAVSQPLAEYMKGALHVPSTKLRVVRNGVDTAAFAPRDRGAGVRAELDVAPGTPIVGSIGRLDAIKGYDVLIEAFRLLRSGWTTGAAPVLVIAGDGPEQSLLGARIAAMDHDVRSDIRMLGWRTDVPELLAAFDIFAMSSRSEGTSVSLLEAMSARLCPVVTDVGGNSDVLGDQLRHRLVASDDPVALAGALRDALQHPGERMRDASRAHDWVETRFSVNAMVRQYEDLYASMGRQ